LVKDYVLGYYRFSAYDLSEAAMRCAGDELLKFRPDYVIGYAVALDALERANANRAERFNDLGIKLIIGAAERFPRDDSRSRMAKTFGCPVAMEYGSVETSLIAHEHPSGGYNVFWANYFIEAQPLSSNSSLAKILVTSLFPRCFPLVRYDVGDEIVLDAPAKLPLNSLRRFANVRGRCNDRVTLTDGTVVHSEAFTHAIRECADVTGYQIVVTDGRPTIYFTSLAPGKVNVADIRRRLSIVHHELAQLDVVHVPRLKQTMAGKTPMIVHIT
jgi:phenylacetate-CoA ligase